MAKENYITLMGQLRTEPRFLRDENGVIKTAMFQLYTLRRNPNDEVGNISPKWDKPVIATSDPKIIRKIETFKVHDIIEVEGIFRTDTSKKRKICPHCGSQVIVETPISTVYPTFVDVRDDRLTSDTDGMKYLLDRAEHSNHAKIIGRVCTPTDKIVVGETDRGDTFARYQLAVNRKLYVIGSEGTEDHTDYPFVYSYKNVAEDDIEILKQGTLIYLDGYVHTMNYDKVCECEVCNNEFSFSWSRMNLTPYSNEYLRDYDELKESTHITRDFDSEVEGQNTNE